MNSFESVFLIAFKTNKLKKKKVAGAEVRWHWQSEIQSGP